VCGIMIGPVRDPAPASLGDVPAEKCPRCGVSRVDPFCAACGYNFTFAAGGPVQPGPAQSSPPPGAAWTAVVTSDRAYYDSVRATAGPDAGAITFPAHCPERRFRLAGTEVRVGRRSARSGVDPEIDLTGPPADPGVSRLHAVLVKATDGSWSVIDPGSANGTLVNGTEIARDQIVPLRDGDRIHLGAWTELKIVREG
jgi:hypothetical protein